MKGATCGRTYVPHRKHFVKSVRDGLGRLLEPAFDCPGYAPPSWRTVAVERPSMCVHVAPSPGQSLCQCGHLQIEAQYAVALADRAAAERAARSRTDAEVVDLLNAVIRGDMSVIHTDPLANRLSAMLTLCTGLDPRERAEAARMADERAARQPFKTLLTDVGAFRA